MLIKVKTTEMATSDLEKYYHALNKYAQLLFSSSRFGLIEHSLTSVAQSLDEVPSGQDGGNQQNPS